MIRTTKQLMRPPFVANWKSIMRDTGRQVAFELLSGQYKYGSKSVTLTAAIIAAATSMSVAALSDSVAQGDVINFSGGKLVVVSAATAPGATTVPIEPAAGPVDNGSTGYYGGSGGGYVRAGTEVDLLVDGRVLPSSMNNAGVTCYGILETSAEEDSATDALSGYGVITQGMVYDNLLPEATGTPKVMDATHKTELLARGGAWLFLQYADDTA